MIINNNIPALNTYRQMGVNQTAAQKAMEKLSSGLRINRAGDDAAGLAISEKMRAQIRGLTQASRNSQDGISMIQTAEGALQEAQNILQRMRVLATQAANDTNVNVDRGEIQKEINQLSSEINRIGNTTEFNTQRLLNGDRSNAKVVTEVTTSIDDQTLKAVSSTGVSTDSGAIAIKDSQIEVDGTAGDGAFVWGSLDSNETNTISISKNADGELEVVIAGSDGTNTVAVTDKLTPQFNANGEFNYNNHGVSFTITQEAFEAATEGAAVTIDLSARDVASTGSGVGTISLENTFNNNAAGASFDNDQIVINGADLSGEFANASRVSVSYDSGANELIVQILDAEDNVLSNDAISWDGSVALTYDNHGVSFELDPLTDASEDFLIALDIDVTENVNSQTVDGSIQFQIGANQNQSMSVSINDMRSQALGVTNSTGGSTWVEISRPHESLLEAGTMITGADAEALGLDGSKYYIEAKFTVTKDVTDGTNSEGAEYALSMEDHASAAAALTVINDAIERVSAQRSQLGAYQNRLEHTIANLDNSAENLQAAESRIRDVDMAREIMEMTRANILAQASQAMLAQANMAPQSVLQLLG